MAPWYCYGMSRWHFGCFPEHTIVVTQVFEDDDINDYRMAEDIFDSFRIRENRKCFISVFTARKSVSTVPAVHALPEMKFDSRDVGKAVVLPVIDSLFCYAFNDSLAHAHENIPREERFRKRDAGEGMSCTFYKGKECVFGTSQSGYLNFWGHGMNPRSKLTYHFPSAIRLTLKTPEMLIRYMAFGIGQYGDDK
jgi:hypothetical protein